MATPRKKPADQPKIQSEEWLGEDVYDAGTLRPALAKLYEMLGIDDNGQAECYVYQLQENTAEKPAQVWKGSPDDYDLHAIAMQHGSGTYRLRLYVPDEVGGRPMIRGGDDFPIKLTPEEEAQRRRRIKALEKDETETPAGGISRGEVQGMIMDRMDTMFARLEAKLVPAQQGDPLAMVERIASIFSKMQPAAVAQPDPFAAFAGMAGVFKTMREILPVPGASDKEGDFYGLMIETVKTMGPALAEVVKLKAAQTTPVAGQPAAPALPAPPAAASSTDVPRETIPPEDVMQQLKLALQYAINEAARGVTPEAFAADLLSKIPSTEESDAQLAELLDRGNEAAFAELVTLEPAIDPYKTWFFKVLDVVRIEFDPPEGGQAA